MAYHGDPLKKILWDESRIPTGTIYEDMFCELLADYCEKNSIEYAKTVGNKIEDRRNGTDFMLRSQLEVYSYGIKPLRLDFTHDFSGKDNMPLVWRQSAKSILTQDGYPVKFGVRIGNKTAGFDRPVAVIGIDAFANEIKNNEDRIRCRTLGKECEILLIAGEMIAAYEYMTSGDYRRYLMEHDEDIGGAPELSPLRPNYGGEAYFGSKYANGAMADGYGLAAALASEDDKNPGKAEKFIDAISRLKFSVQPKSKSDLETIRTFHKIVTELNESPSDRTPVD